uniref:Uncharacterized protein n=1 Tax=Ananas comosus var. bracteatus TaxID=296719 RepID=A0A6V7QWT1_ANACO
MFAEAPGNGAVPRPGGGNKKERDHMIPNLPQPHSDPLLRSSGGDQDADLPSTFRHSSSSAAGGYSSSDYASSLSGECSPFAMSPWNSHPTPAQSPYHSSPWNSGAGNYGESDGRRGRGRGRGEGSGEGGRGSMSAAAATARLMGSLVREEGHIYSLAAAGDVLYTGSDSKNIRVWKKQRDMAGFKSSSGLVKAIVIAGDRIFTGHQDGKIRVWRVSPKNPAVHKRVGSLPRLKDFIRTTLNPSTYIGGGGTGSSGGSRSRGGGGGGLWIRHSDAVSCLSAAQEQQGLLYSGSWDKTFKVWRIADSKCLESVRAHDDAVNAVVAAPFDALVFTGSADGTVKVWRRELQGKGTRHAAVQTLLKQESAVTALAVAPVAPVVYCGSSDGVVNFWEADGDAPPRAARLAHGGALRGHKMAVLCLASAGALLLSGSADTTICVWRRDHGGAHACLAVLTAHAGPVKCLAVVDDRDFDDDPAPVSRSSSSAAPPRWIVYSGSLDKSVKVWRVSEEPPEALLRGPQHVPLGTPPPHHHHHHHRRRHHHHSNKKIKAEHK